MKRFAPRLAAVWLLSLAATASAIEFPAPVKTLELADGDTVVFLGDSITHQCLYTQYVEDFFYTRFPNKRIRFHNAGVGGAKAWDALQRFEKDVAAYKPKYVTVLLGMNDGAYQPFSQEIFDTYMKDMTQVVEQIKAAGAMPVLMTPTMFDARASRMRDKNGDRMGPREEFYNSTLAYYGTWLRDVAHRNGLGFVDMWSPLNNITIAQRKTDPQFTLIRDAVHPDAPGQLVMAYAILEDMGLRGPLSVIRLDVSRDQVESSTGGRLTQIVKAKDTLTFTWAAESLPFVVPEEARPGAKLLRLGHRASREALIVNGLPMGQWELLIDGESVGQYSDLKLAAGVELQENEKTPQYRQALQVAELNKQKNDGPVHALRAEWARYQGYARTKRQVAEHPEDAKAAENLKKLEEQIAGMEERIAKAEAEAKAIEDQIYQINTPQPHEYVLRPAAGRRAARNGAARVAGVVTLDGRPLSGGRILFVGEDGTRIEGTTDENGRYRLTEWAPVGEYRVEIDAAEVSEKYKGERSALRASIAPGGNVFDLDLRR